MPSELDLVRQFLEKGDEQSFRQLYQDITPAVYRYALRFLGSKDDAEDVIQETWIRAVKNLSTYSEKSSFKTWLTGISINCCRELLRKRSRWEDFPQEESRFFDPTETPINVIDLENALDKLSSGYKEILLLHDLEGYKHHEIGEMLGISEGTSKSQLFNARRTMRKYLQE